MVGGAGESTAVTVMPLWGPEHNGNRVRTIKYINVSLDNRGAGEVHYKSPAPARCLVDGDSSKTDMITRCHPAHWESTRVLSLCVSPWASLTTVTPLARCTLCHWSRSADTCLCHEDQWHHMCLSRYVTLPEFLISTKCCCHNHCCCCCHNDQIATKESPAHWPAHCKHNQIQSCFVRTLRHCTGNMRWCNDICAIQYSIDCCYSGTLLSSQRWVYFVTIVLLSMVFWSS